MQEEASTTRRWWQRKPKAEKPIEGEIVVDGNDEHRCRPPGCHEWPAGKWYVDDTRKYPEGTVWRCPCGKAWKSSRYRPGVLGASESGGLWLNWYRFYDLDVEPVQSGSTGGPE